MKTTNLLCVLLCLCSLAFAQNPPSIANVAIPPSPEASALAQYSEIPVAHYTGVPQISLPLANLSGRNLSLPVSLSYHASGIRVDQVASREGLGWSLNAGGAITRTVNGGPDELNGYFSDRNLIPTPGATVTGTGNLNGYTQSEYEKIRTLATGGLDGAPDRFSINFPGGSGQIIFDANNEPHLAPFQLMDISVDWNAKTWTVRTPDGVTYEFGGTNATEITAHNSNCGEATPPFVSAWYLTKITGPWGDEITLEYESDGVHATPERISRTEYGFSTCMQKAPQICASSSAHSAIRLKRISAVGGKVEFEYDTQERDDLAQSHRLKMVRIFDRENVERKSQHLIHSYWAGRLLLDQVYEAGDSCTRKPSTRFFYDKTHKLPDYTSFSQDHWGFFNGKLNTSPVPKTSVANCVTIGTADRAPDFEYGKSGVLVGMEMSTGGLSEFEYEPHDTWAGANQYEKVDTVQNNLLSWSGSPATQIETFVLDFDQCVSLDLDLSNAVLPASECEAGVKIYDDNGTVIRSFACNETGQQKEYLTAGTYRLETAVNVNGDEARATAYFQKHGAPLVNRTLGGLRIKKITVKDDPDPANNMVREFVYRQEEFPDRSSGRLLTEPIYAYAHTDYIDPSAGGSGGGGGSGSVNWIPCGMMAVQSSPRLSIGNSQGSHVVYPDVTALSGPSGSNGKTDFHYTSDIEVPEPPSVFPFGPVENRDYKRGLLKSSVTWDNTGKRVTSTENTFVYRTENHIEQPGYQAGFSKLNSGSEGASDEEIVFRTWNWVSEWFYQATTTSRAYDDNGVDYVETVTTNLYENPAHGMPTGSWTTDSEGRKLINRTKYVADFATGYGDPAASAISKLKEVKFIHAVPVEQTVWEDRGNGERLLSANLTTYKEFPGGAIMPHELYFLENDSALVDFTASQISGGFSKDVRYELRETAELYSGKGKLLRAKRKDGVSVGWKWDADEMLPVGQYVNAAPAAGNALDCDASIADFETGEEVSLEAKDDYWAFNAANIHVQDAHTGKYAREIAAGNPQYGPTRNIRPAQQEGIFIFSAWAKTASGHTGGKLVLHTKEDDDNATAIFPSTSIAPSYQTTSIPSTGGQWQYFEVRLDLDKVRSMGNVGANDALRLKACIVNEDAGKTLLVDNLRLQRSGARLTSSTYDAMGLKTSDLDANNIAAFFEYDPLLRLSASRDEDRNVLTRHRYQYARNDLPLTFHSDGPGYLSQPINLWLELASQCPNEEPTSIQWDFGDGQTALTNGLSTSHSYSSSGSYTVTATASSPQGGNTVITGTVLVQASAPPLANAFSITIDGSPPGPLLTVEQGDVVQITENVSGGVSPYSFEWQKLEGNQLTTIGTGTSVSVTTATSPFRIRLNVTDNAGTTATFETDLFIYQNNN